MKKIIFLYFALMALGVYAMPDVATVFANQHSFYKSSDIKCVSCHTDVKAQVETGDQVFLKHSEAALNSTYATYLAIGGISYDTVTRNITAYGNYTWTWNGSVWINQSDPSQYQNVTLDENNNGAIDSGEVCMLCHGIITGMTAHAGSMAVAACDDDRCHGNRNYVYNDPDLFGIASSITAAGLNISANNIHSSFYLTTSSQSTQYPALSLFGYTHGNVYNNSVSRGYYTCLGCHSDLSANIDLILAPTYDHSNGDQPQGRYQ